MSNLADEMQANALEAQKFSCKHLVLELDFSEASIAELEDTVDAVEYAIQGGKSDENVEMLSRIWGAYIGEALRKQCGGQWVSQDNGRVAFKGASATVYPQEQVRRRLTEGPDHNLATYFEEALSSID